MIEFVDYFYFMLYFYAVLLFVCSPSGWDSEKKISILYDSMSSMKPDDHFNDVIVRPVTRKVLFSVFSHESFHFDLSFCVFCAKGCHAVKLRI